VARRRGLDARTTLLFALMVGEAAGLFWFSRTETVSSAVAAMITFGLFTHMACGATYALVPFIDRKSLGGVAGIVGAGGNVGAVAAGFLLKGMGGVQQCFPVLAGTVLVASGCAIAIRFTATHKATEQVLYERAIVERESVVSMPSTAMPAS
jgi:NNP family nitrate/nitrite transporter-like MFS transporter